MDLDRIGKISTSSIFDSESPRRNSYSQSSPDNIFLVKYVMSQSPAISQPDLGLVSQKYFRLENIDQKIFSQTNKINATDHPTKRERERKSEICTATAMLSLHSPVDPPLCFQLSCSILSVSSDHKTRQREK